MTGENVIQIKAQQKNWLLKGIISLIMMLASLFVALLPLLSSFAESNSMLFYICGGIDFVAFLSYFVFLLYKESKPNNALVLTARGFTDYKNVGEDIVIEWTNVTSVKMLGKSNMPFLGVTLENSDIILAKMKKNKAIEMRENIDHNLPTILIPQNEVRMSIKDLKDLFVKFAREARTLETNTPKKQKNNPFTTEDVLRAFGKLPAENEAEKTKETEPKTIDESEVEPIVEPITEPAVEPIIEQDINHESPIQIPVFDDIVEKNEESAISDISDAITPDISESKTISDNKIGSPFMVPEEIASPIPNADKEKHVSASDSFYETLRAKASAKNSNVSETHKIDSADTAVAPSDSTNDSEQIPNEFKELLSQAKSSKIAELEKILIEDDIPYSLSKENTNIPHDTDIPEDTESIHDEIDIVETNDNVVLDDSNDESEQLDTTLDSLIKSVLESSESDSFDSSSNGQSMGDTREFILDLSKAIDEKTKQPEDNND